MLEPILRDPGVEANARLTGYVGVVLAVLLAAELVTGLRFKQLLPAHAVIGFVLVPPVLLKLASVGYRFARYYTGDARYRAAGPPRLAMRLLGPVIVLLTVVVIGTGIELWLFGYRFGFVWVPVHHFSAYLWFVTMAVHVVNYLRRAPELAAADWRDHLRGAFTRRSLVAGSLILGAALAIAMLPYPTPFIPTGGAD
ncbi:MAG: hypothetical protein E6I58_16325 [Chloroflexi bacterium]|nr:MAG: hypothetical protein E6I58_16325 [Chloroflexota bacterium]